MRLTMTRRKTRPPGKMTSRVGRTKRQSRRSPVLAHSVSGLRLGATRPAALLLAGVLALLSLLSAHGAFALDAPDVDDQLASADRLKTADPAAFTEIVQRIDAAALTNPQRHYLSYLRGWRSAYDGDYHVAVQTLRPVIDQAEDATLRFRARATVVNVMAVATRYEEAFFELNELIKSLPTISDASARQQGLGVIAVLYNQVGEYNLGLG